LRGKTHLAAGLAAALAVCAPQSLTECAAVCIGGAVGGLLCDIDQHAGRGMQEMKSARWFAAAGSLAVAAAEHLAVGGLWRSLTSQPPERQLAGVAILALTLWKGFRSEHRTFAHSLLFVLLVSVGCGLVCPPFAAPVLAGLVSHMALDLLNKKPLRLLWPLPVTLCLHLCASDGAANRWIGRAAAAATAVLAAWRILYFIHP